MSETWDQLTEAQQAAVSHVDGPMLVLAGPGSGKTRVVTRRIAHLIELGIAPRSILALTFTNKAAGEMLNRVRHLCPDANVTISTFHRFCARLLREFAPFVGLEPNYSILDTADSQTVLRRVLNQLEIDTTHYSPQLIASQLSAAKNHLILPGEYKRQAGNPLTHVVSRVYPEYQRSLLSANGVDFDDLLLHVAVMLRDNPELRESLDQRFRYVLVDEYQDTNRAQYAISRALSINYPNLAVTGDPDQSIYGWRGANIRNILDFERDYPDVKVVRLEQNYRSTGRILSVASALIAHNTQRKEKALFTHNDQGAAVRLVTYPSQTEEAEAIAAQISRRILSGTNRPRDFAVFYRVNALSRGIESAMRQFGLPYQLVNAVEFYQRQEVKDVLAYLMLLVNPRNDVAFLRAVNTPARGIGKTTLTRLTERAREAGTSLLEGARSEAILALLPKKSAASLAEFSKMIESLQSQGQGSAEAAIGQVLSKTGYRDHLLLSQSEEDHERLANIEELLSAAREFDERNPERGLEGFLEEACLVNDTDAWDEDHDRVTLMTLHASKGLEFPVVFLIAFEDGLIPHERSRDNPLELEEERRLLFVGMTRPQKELHLSRATYREFRGQRRMTIPSQFFRELPRDEMEIDDRTPSFSAIRDSSEMEFPAEVDHGDPDFPAQDAAEPWEEFSTSPEVREPSAAARSPARIVTAAEFAGQKSAAAEGAHPDDFVLGLVVRHPEYGLGKIVSLSGSGVRRTAMVAFATCTTMRKFVLAQSELVPISRR